MQLCAMSVSCMVVHTTNSYINNRKIFVWVDVVLGNCLRYQWKKFMKLG